MTLQQLRYVTTVAETGTMSEAARRLLFLSQDSQKQLENWNKRWELSFLTGRIRESKCQGWSDIFRICKAGAGAGITFGRALQLQAGGKKEFSVSTQHYSFAVNAFVDLIKEFGGDNYDFSLRETQTYEIIDDVAKMRSEIGILYLNDFNRTVLKKINQGK